MKKKEYEIPDFNPYSTINIIYALAGYVGIVIKRMTWARGFFFALNVVLSYFLLNYQDKTLAIIYIALANSVYLWYLLTALKPNGLGDYWCKKYGKDKAYRIYEAILGFIFFHPANSLIYFNMCFAGESFSAFLSKDLQYIFYIILFSFGLFVKLWSAVLVGVDVYYCRDMFLKRKVVPFQKKGVYRFFKNPMYGVGHFHAYSIPLQYGSWVGFIPAIINQAIVYIFYHTLEKKFIRNFYLKK